MLVDDVKSFAIQDFKKFVTFRKINRHYILLILFFPKALVSNLMSIKEEFMKLRQVLRHLRPTFTDSDGIGLLRTVWALWEKWLHLLEVAKEWEMWCEELKQEWKFVNEEVSASFSLFVNPYLRHFFFIDL